MSEPKPQTKMLKLALIDEAGNVLDSWVSDDEHDRIVFEAVAQAVGWWAPTASTIKSELARYEEK